MADNDLLLGLAVGFLGAFAAMFLFGMFSPKQGQQGNIIQGWMNSETWSYTDIFGKPRRVQIDRQVHPT